MLDDKDKTWLLSIQDPIRRRASFMALLSKEMLDRGKDAPVIVGGHAVEIYTQGAYTSLDIDVKGERDTLYAILDEIGFERHGSNFVHEELDIFIQWLGNGPDPRSEDPDHLTRVVIPPDLYIRLVGFEDLIIDRLCQAKHWKVTDARMWAEKILEAAMTGENTELDLDYLGKRAESEGVADFLREILDEAGKEQENANPRI